MQTMQNEKSGMSETSYAETPFTGAQALSEHVWVAAKDLFPDMSSSELEVSYSSKNKLQVKMFGAGKKTYDLFTKDKTGRDQINPKLSKEIKKALRASKYEQDQQELQKNKKSSKRSDTRIHRKKKIKIKWMK